MYFFRTIQEDLMKAKTDFMKYLVTIVGFPAIICKQENAYVMEKTPPVPKIFFKEAIKNGLEGRPKNSKFIAFQKC